MSKFDLGVAKAAGQLWTMAAVVPSVGVENRPGVGPVPYQRLVEDLAPQACDDPFAAGGRLAIWGRRTLFDRASGVDPAGTGALGPSVRQLGAFAGPAGVIGRRLVGACSAAVLVVDEAGRPHG